MSSLIPFTFLNEDLYKFYAICTKITNSSPNPSEKDLYFKRVNEYGVDLLNLGKYQEVEIFYKQCLFQILEFEKQHNVFLAKGMPLVNLGIAQIALGKIEEGTNNIISAKVDDHKYGPNISLGSFQFYTQFEIIIIEKVLQLFLKTDSSDYKRFINKLDYKIENRLFQFLILNRLYNNFLQFQNDKNINVKLIIFTTLRDQCLLIEQILRDQNYTGKYYSDILKDANLIADSSNCSHNSEIDFNQNLITVLGIINESEKAFKVSLCIRNFNNHHFNLTCNELFNNLTEIINLTVIKTGIILNGLI